MSASERVAIKPHNIADIGEFELSRGFDEKVAARVVALSKQPGIVATAPRDASERFPDVATAMEWYQSSPDRIFYSLGYHAHLAGIIWFTKTSMLDAERTFAIRVYEPFGGHGLGTNFAKAAHHDLAEDYGGSLWADIHVDNIPSQKLARNVGYLRIEDHVSLDPTRLQLRRPGLAE
jgi:hypothetical protein